MKKKTLISGLTVAGLLASGGIADAASFTMAPAGSPSLTQGIHEEDAKKEKEGNCSDEQKKKKTEGEGGCGEGSCNHFW